MKCFDSMVDYFLDKVINMQELKKMDSEIESFIIQSREATEPNLTPPKGEPVSEMVNEPMKVKFTDYVKEDDIESNSKLTLSRTNRKRTMRTSIYEENNAFKFEKLIAATLQKNLRKERGSSKAENESFTSSIGKSMISNINDTNSPLQKYSRNDLKSCPKQNQNFNPSFTMAKVMSMNDHNLIKAMNSNFKIRFNHNLGGPTTPN